MGKAIVPRRPRPAKGTGGPVAHPPKGLTLANVMIARRVAGVPLTCMTGREVAQLMEAMKPRDGRPSFIDAEAIWEELDCLGDLCHVLADAAHKGIDVSLEKSLYWIGERLKRVGGCVMALEQDGNAAPNWYAVEEVKK